MRCHLLASVLARLDAFDDLSVNEICANRVHGAVVPGRKQLLAKAEPPGDVLFLFALPSHLLLTLRDRIQHVIPAAAQRAHLPTTQQNVSS